MRPSARRVLEASFVVNVRFPSSTSRIEFGYEMEGHNRLLHARILIVTRNMAFDDMRRDAMLVADKCVT